MPKLFLLLINLVLIPFCYLNAQISQGVVIDSVTKKSIPFATIKFGSENQGIVADLHGKFEIDNTFFKTFSVPVFEVSSLGYKAKTVTVSKNRIVVELAPFGAAINEITVSPPYKKLRRILDSVLKHKDQNNPDKMDWYQCKVYYKMVADGIAHIAPGQVLTQSEENENAMLKKQHLLVNETYSTRTWKYPKQLQDDILATRLSGFKQPMFTSMVTNVLPFHAYSNYLEFNGKDYHNPISKGSWEHFKFNLSDEFMTGADSVWVLSFMPKGNKSNDIKGRVFINSNGYAITNLMADVTDTMLRLTTHIEQEYEQVNAPNNEKRWFPRHLNYIINWEQSLYKKAILIRMQGMSDIDSVNFTQDPGFVFDKSHTIRLQKDAIAKTNQDWVGLRPNPLDDKENRTYRTLDSLGDKKHFDRVLNYFSKIIELKVPVSFIDVDLKSLFDYNDYEGPRIGLGVQTNEKLLKHLSVGGYAAYGITDQTLKYGVFAEVYFEKYKEFTLKAMFANDVTDPGRLKLDPDLDNAYLNSYLLWFVDNTKTYSASVTKKLGYWNFGVSGFVQQVVPKYNYTYSNDGNTYKSYNANEVDLNMRYAFAERTAPYFKNYYSLGSNYPIWYAKLTYGRLDSGKLNMPYTQLLSAVAWDKHINRIGFEHILIEGGKSWSKSTLPLGKLFAGNGFNANVTGNDPSYYTFGGLMTITPYQFYTDQFISLVFRHDFDWKLYALQFGQSKLSSIPALCLQYALLYGTLENAGTQQGFPFSVPGNGYHEVGVLIKDILRVKYLNLCYLTLDCGYFYHLTPTIVADNIGNVAIGARLDL